MKRKVRVYVAGPLSHGDVAANVRKAINAADELANAGYIVYLPHLTHFWSIQHSHTHDFWLEQDFAWLAECDVMYRIPGTSPGADKEEVFCNEHGIPVCKLLADLVDTPYECVEEE